MKIPNLNNHSKVNIFDVADIERALQGKIYPAGSTLIALSATRGQVEYMPEAGYVETRYAVVVPKVVCVPYYLFIVIQEAFPEYLSKYMTGINLQFDNLKYLEVEWHQDIEAQAYISEMMRQADDAVDKVQQEIERLEDMKKFFLDRLFPSM